MLSIVIPVYNRVKNLELVLHGLRLQQEAPEFEVIIVDDGSSDGLLDWLVSNYRVSNVDGLWLRYFSDTLPDVQIKYFNGGPNKGFRGGRARNIGAFNASSRSNWFVFIDSDVILNEYALKHYGIATSMHDDGRTVIVGAYHWLTPFLLTTNEISKLVTYDFADLDAINVNIPVDKTKEANGIIGLDPRSQDFTMDVLAVRQDGALGSFSGNIAYPKKLFNEIGGFDEIMSGHGGEDCDLSLTAAEHGAQYLFYKPLFGWHMWHPRDQARNEREVAANILYIDSKHAIGSYANSKKWTDSRDYSDPAQYHKHRTGIALKLAGSPTVYAARDDLKTRIGIPTLEWFTKLGFVPDDIKTVTNDELVMYKLCGVARED